MQETAASYEGAVPERVDDVGQQLGWPDTSQLQSTCDLPVKQLGLNKKVSAFEGIYYSRVAWCHILATRIC